MIDRYCSLITIDGLLKRHQVAIQENREFLRDLIEQSPGLVEGEKEFERKLQRQLMQFIQPDDPRRQRAKECLRCFISHQIERNCLDLEKRFGSQHNFTRYNIFPYVLDSYSPNDLNANEQSLTTRILNTFNPDKGSLTTWTTIKFNGDLKVKRLLLEYGIYLETDWTILNYTTITKLKRILSNYGRTEAEINQASQLLNSYHCFYRDPVQNQRTPGDRSPFPQPNLEQLNQIAEQLSTTQIIAIVPEKVLTELKTLARLLRPNSPSLREEVEDIEDIEDFSETLPSSDENDEQLEFLKNYRQQLEICVKQSVKKVIEQKFKYLQKKNKPKDLKKAQNYLKGLYLFHCKAISMAEIATELNLVDQPNVTRLLALKDLREDTKRNTLSCLEDCVLELANFYANPEQLKDLNSEVQSFLEEEIDTLIQESAQEASTRHRQVMNSTLARKICQYLQNRQELNNELSN